MKHPATTLVEILVYFAVVAIFLLVAMTFALQIFTANGLSANFNELQYNVDFVTQHVSSAIQRAESVNVASSVFDQDSGTLALGMTEAGDSPTIFTLINGDVFMTEGIGSPVQLNTNTVTVDKLRFHQITSPKTPDQIMFDAAFSNAEQDIEQMNKTFTSHTTLSLRQ